MASRLAGYQGDRAILYAAVVEFVHTATLVHDEIIDDSELRRGRLAVHSRWGNDITVLLGDYLYIKSMSMALTHGTLDVVRLLCDVTLKMIEGELYQLTKNGDAAITEDEHFDIIRRKTAYLFGGSAEIGGLLGKVTPERQQALREYGFNLGIAFQIVDDLLDFTGDTEAVGKPVGSDLREGKVTLHLLHELEKLETEHPELVTPDSPTQRVGGRLVEGFATVEHKVPMLSLDNAYNEEELRAFDERVRKGAGIGDTKVAYVAEMKIDGLSIALTYENGRLARGATRGDGTRGEDVTHNVRTIRAIPLSLKDGPKGSVEIRGEVYLSRASFARMNKEREDAGEPLFANPRNAAAGTMRNLDPSLVAKRGLGAFTYQIVTDAAIEDVTPT